MKVLSTCLALAVLLTATHARAAEISFQLLARTGGERVEIASGTKTYGPADFELRREYRNGTFYAVNKTLALANGYGVGTMDSHGQEVLGFGLWVEHLPLGSHPLNFSWEWYDHLERDLYEKRQGRSRVALTFAGLPVVRALRSITFLEDVEFRYVEDICRDRGNNRPTHVLIIRKGSVLEFPYGAQVGDRITDDPFTQMLAELGLGPFPEGACKGTP